MKLQVSPMAWSPLGGGKVLQEQHHMLYAKAPKYSATQGQLALAWLLKHPSSVFPVVGTTSAERLGESSNAVSIQLDIQDWFEMLQIAQGKEMP